MSHNLDASHISMTLQYIGVRFRRFIHVLQQPNPPSNWFQLVMLEVVGSVLKSGLVQSFTLI